MTPHILNPTIQQMDVYNSITEVGNLSHRVIITLRNSDINGTQYLQPYRGYYRGGSWDNGCYEMKMLKENQNDSGHRDEIEFYVTLASDIVSISTVENVIQRERDEGVQILTPIFPLELCKLIMEYHDGDVGNIPKIEIVTIPTPMKSRGLNAEILCTASLIYCFTFTFFANLIFRTLPQLKQA